MIKRGFVCGMSVILLCVAVLSAGCLPSFSSAGKTKTFSKEGMSIVLPGNFVEGDRVNTTAYYSSTKAAISIIKDEFLMLEMANLQIGDLTLEKYAALVIENNNHNAVVEKQNGLVCFEYQLPTDKESTCFAMVFKGKDAFWLVQFVCKNVNFEDYKANEFVTWAKSFSIEPFDAASWTSSLVASTFTEAGMSIDLPPHFRKMDILSQTVAYMSNSAAVMMLKEGFAVFDNPKDMTLDDYAGMVIEVNELAAAVEQKDGLTCFTYSATDEVTGLEFAYFAVVFKGDDAFWLVQFYSAAKDFDSLLPSFVAWAKTFRTV